METLQPGKQSQSSALRRTLPPNQIITLLVKAVNSDNTSDFYRVVEEYQKTLSPTGEYSKQIKRLLNEKPKRLTHLSSLSDDIKKLVVQREVSGEYIFLNEDVQNFISDLLTEWKHADTLRYHNLPLRNKILFHGPTGNGKTTIARHIAQLTDLPFFEVNADIVIDSRIGNSGANIHKIFNQLQMPCVLFWDEVDTIGRARGKGNDSAAGMENERMVNSILVNLEKLSPDVIFIGATNRRDVLDTAFLRRFDCQFELSAPSNSDKARFAQSLISYYKLPFNGSYNSVEFNNFSEIKLDMVDRARRFILNTIREKS